MTQDRGLTRSLIFLFATPPVLCVVGLIMSALGIGRDDPADQDRSDLAEAICEMAIQDESGVADARIRYPVTVKDGVVYEVTGMAEVRYMLGGRDDTSFTCRVRDYGDEWGVLELRLD
jgi:hypothetical protein